MTRASKAGLRDDQVVPQRDAAIAVLLLLLGIHLPHDLARGARPHIDLGHDAPAVDHIHEAVLDQRRQLEVLVLRGAAERDREASLRFFTFNRLMASSAEKRWALKS